MKHRLFLLLLCSLLGGALFGCGSNSAGPLVAGTTGNQQGTGRATFTMVWPPASRLIPQASNSIKVEIRNGATSVASQTLARPTGGGPASVTFNVLPIGTLNVTATAYPNTDGTGTAQATANASLAVQANQNTAFTLTMASTIDHLEKSPTSLSLFVGQASSITITAKDASGAIVLIAAQKLQWRSSDTAVARVDTTGKVTGVAVGGTTTPVQITVTETESNQSVSIPVVVADSGTLIAEDHFNYTPGSQLVGLSGGTGFGDVWQQNGPGASTLISNSNLTYGNLVTSDHCAETQSGDPIGNAHPFTTPLITGTKVIYFSILLRPIDPIGSGNFGSYCGLTFANLFVGITGASHYYGMENLGGGGFAGSNVLAQQNVTVFLVLRATFKNGNDQFDLWVNPVPGQPLPPTPDATKTDLDVGPSLDSLNIGASTRCQFDEMRVGTTYAAVSPTQ